jgi:hypothetical protein
MKDFISDEDRLILERKGLTCFDAFWGLRCPTVDVPNLDRKGWSRVSRLDLEERVYYLKRQCDHLTRSLARPFGEPTLAREFRSIQRFRTLGLPTVEASFYAERRIPGRAGMRFCAVLLIPALDGWRDAQSLFSDWDNISRKRANALFAACGRLARRLHDAGLMHGCFYPKHVFVREIGKDVFEACLIDLEKVRRLWLGHHDRIKDLEQFFRRLPDEKGMTSLLSAYLGCAPEDPKIAKWRERLQKRRGHKESRE